MRLTGLWRHPDFLKLWAGQTVSVFGSLITGLALPLVAVLTLAAGPFEVAVLGADGIAPGLLLGLPAGVWVDRLPRRPLLIAADFGRALALVSVPVAALSGALRLEHLYLVAAINSALGVIFEVAYRAYLPVLVRPDELVEGNSKLEASNSVAEVSGFGLAGVLVQALTAPVAILVDALTFVVSGVSLLLIRASEPPRRSAAGAAARPATWREVGAGLAWVWRQPALRALAATAATRTVSAGVFVAIMLLFFIRELGLEPALIGLLYSIGGLSALPGALLAERVVRRWGTGRTLIGSYFVDAATNVSMALAVGPPPVAVAMVAVPQLTDGAGIIYQITQRSLIQAITPARLLGRVTASLHVVEQGALLLGLLAGGALGELIGLRATFILGTLGTVLAGLWLLRSPLPSLAEPQPSTEPEPTPVAPGA